MKIDQIKISFASEFGFYTEFFEHSLLRRSRKICSLVQLVPNRGHQFKISFILIQHRLEFLQNSEVNTDYC